MQGGRAYVRHVFTELSTTSTSSVRPLPQATRRAGTITLETQSALKFALAIALGAAAVWTAMPVAAAALLMVVAVVIASRSLTVLAADPASARSLRPREHAAWDGAFAAVLAVLAIVVAAADFGLGAVAIGVGALAVAGLRLRTRYVAG